MCVQKYLSEDRSDGIKTKKNVAVNAIIHRNQCLSEVVNALSLDTGEKASHQKTLMFSH